MTVTRALCCVLTLSLLAIAAPDGRAQSEGAMPVGGRRAAGVPSDKMPAALRDVAFDQRLDEQIPLDIPFRDEQGRAVTLDRFFGRRPVVLALVYYECPMLCTQVLNGLVGSLDALAFDAGREYEVVIVSFDPRESPELAAAKRATYLERYARPGTEGGWHFLTGEQSSIRRLTDAVGFRYVFDKSLGQFAHPSGITVLTPQGRLARYFFGIEYAARDLRLAVVEASANRIGSPIDQVLLYCYHYDPATGRYGLMVMRLVRLGGLLTVVALAAFIVVMRRGERR
jgi:protein SCO1/2